MIPTLVTFFIRSCYQFQIVSNCRFLILKYVLCNYVVFTRMYEKTEGHESEQSLVYHKFILDSFLFSQSHRAETRLSSIAYLYNADLKNIHSMKVIQKYIW